MRAPPGRSWGGSGTAGSGGEDGIWPRVGRRSPERGGSSGALRPVPPPSPPRAPGPKGGRTEFPSAGAPVSPASQQAPFCLPRERGNGKGGEEAGVCYAAPGPVQTPRVRGQQRTVLLQRTGPPAADCPLSGVRHPPSGHQHSWLPQASHPLPTEPELWAGTWNTQVTEFGVPWVCFRGAPPKCPGVPTLERSVPPTTGASGGLLQAGTAGKHLAQGGGRCGLTAAPPPSSFFPDSG